MTSFASVVLAACVVGAPAPAAETPPVPDTVAARVAAAIADAWKAPAAVVRLDWPHVPFVQLAGDPPLHLLGTGANGWFAVRFDSTATGTLVLRVRAGVSDSVSVAVRPLAVGVPLQPGDLATERRFHYGPPRPANAERPGPGWELRRAVAAGDVVDEPTATAPTVIRAGEPVQVVWDRGDVHVTVQGTALQSARRGGPVRVRMPGARASITAVATGPGLAAVDEGGTR